jgi:kynurenine formamidase
VELLRVVLVEDQAVLEEREGCTVRGRERSEEIVPAREHPLEELARAREFLSELVDPRLVRLGLTPFGLDLVGRPLPEAVEPVEEDVELETLITIPSGGFYSQQWTFGEHSGTHMDAPGHFVEGGRLSPDITLEELFVPIAVVDISDSAEREPDTMVTVDDLRRYERRHGRIPKGALVCMDSGWAAKVDDPLAFKGGAAFPNYYFPGFSLDAAMWLAERRDVTAIGVDTISLDPGNSSTFPVHVNFLATDRYGLEGMNNLDRIPPRGAVAYVGLIPWEEGSGGPCRVIASW